MRKSFSTKKKREASNMLLEGVPVKKVAQMFGVHFTTIYDLKKVEGHGHIKKDRASHVITLRLSDEEFTALNAFVADAGLPSKSAALRALIRSASGFLELRRDEFVDLSDVKSELKKQGVNLNQITTAINKAAKMGLTSMSKQERAFLADLSRTYKDTDSMVSKAFREVRQKGRAAFHSGARL